MKYVREREKNSQYQCAWASAVRTLYGHINQLTMEYTVHKPHIIIGPDTNAFLKYTSRPLIANAINKTITSMCSLESIRVPVIVSTAHPKMQRKMYAQLMIFPSLIWICLMEV